MAATPQTSELANGKLFDHIQGIDLSKMKPDKTLLLCGVDIPAKQNNNNSVSVEDQLMRFVIKSYLILLGQ